MVTVIVVVVAVAAVIVGGAVAAIAVVAVAVIAVVVVVLVVVVGGGVTFANVSALLLPAKCLTVCNCCHHGQQVIAKNCIITAIPVAVKATTAWRLHGSQAWVMFIVGSHAVAVIVA